MQLSEQKQFQDYIARKADKIVSALYMITNLLPTEEPMKWSLRRKCIALLEVTSDNSQNGLDLANASEVVSELSLRVSNARMCQVISTMNSDVILEACSNLKDELDRNVADSMLALNSGFFDVGKPVENVTASQGEQLSAKQGLSMSKTDKEPQKLRTDQSRTFIKDKSNNRKDIILGIVKENGHASVSDIKKIIKSVSEKTIQRDLVSLVDEGKIEREGDRRWARYKVVV